MVNAVKRFMLMLNNVLQMHLKLLQKRVIKKTAESTDHLIANKIANKTTKN